MSGDALTVATIELRDETLPFAGSPVLILIGPWIGNEVTLKLGDIQINVRHDRLAEALKRLAP